MSAIHSKNNILKIPSHWTEAQADAVFEFVNELAAAVFETYEKEFVESAVRENSPEEISDVFGPFRKSEYDDDIPC